MFIKKNNKGQAIAPPTVPISDKVFEKKTITEIIWLGNSGVLVNSRGTNIMIDPLLVGFDMPLLIEVPITPEAVKKVDATLITHSDNDHFSIPTCKGTSNVCSEFHGPFYVANMMKSYGINGIGHNINERFRIGGVNITLTPADHAWQNEYLKDRTREFMPSDFCGYWLDTPDGSIWAIGDSRLLDDHLNMPNPDVILLDFSDSEWHIGFEGAVKLANTYLNSKLVLWHWGSVDAPFMKEFNGNPMQLESSIRNPERIVILAPGQGITLCKNEV